jgi:hypothetical protein
VAAAGANANLSWVCIGWLQVVVIFNEYVNEKITLFAQLEQPVIEAARPLRLTDRQVRVGCARREMVQSCMGRGRRSNRKIPERLQQGALRQCAGRAMSVSA